MSNSIWSQMFGGEAEEKKPVSADAVIRINAARCPQNHPCPSVRVCPVEALSQSGYRAPKADMDKCIKCGTCKTGCPFGAIKEA